MGLAHFVVMNGWKNLKKPLSLAESGGHEIRFEGRRVYPYSFLLKHYPVRSQAHGEKKIFRERRPRYDPELKATGWHYQYDHIREGYSFLRSPAELPVFDEASFNRTYIGNGLQIIDWVKEHAKAMSTTEQDKAVDLLSSELASKRETIQSLAAEIAEKNQVLNSVTTELSSKNNELERMKALLKRLATQVAEKNQKILALVDHVAERQGAVASLTMQLTGRHEKVLTLVDLVAERQKAVDSVATDLSDSQNKVMALTAQAAVREAELRKIRSTLGWRLSTLYGKIKYPYLLPIYRLLNLTGREPAAAGRDEAVDQIISLYQEVIAENISIGQPHRDEESRAASGYLRWLASRVKAVCGIENRALGAELARDRLATERERLQTKSVEQEQTLESLSATVESLSTKAVTNEAQLQRITNSLGWRMLSRYGPIKHRFVLPAYKSIGQVFRSGPLDKNNQSSAARTANKNPTPSIIKTRQATQHQPLNAKDIFTQIYHRNAWGDSESVSGPGSSIARTSVFRAEIAVLLEEFGVRSLLDAGCGDFNWMKEVKLDLDRYIGADVVPELILENQRKYGDATRSFLITDITRDKLPRVDVILSRDCLVHLSFDDIFAAIQNFEESGSTYLLTTTFASVDRNNDINTGAWRPLNLQLFPFDFPAPLKLIDEKRVHQGVSVHKYLALWTLKELPQPEWTMPDMVKSE